MNEAQWDELIAGVRGGDDAALGDFFRQYGPALERLAARAIEPQMRRRFGPESIAQSVCRTFLRRARGDGYDLPDVDSLWRLLCAIALTKVREKARYHLRQKRGVDREVPLDAARDVAATGAPTPEEQVDFADQFAHVVNALDDEERQLLELRLEDRTQEQIATELGCSERTVRRLLRRVEARLLDAFGA